MQQNRHHPHLNIAIEAALKAGKIISRAFDRPDRLKISEKGPNDLVTQIDHESEAEIIRTIHAANPRHCILAEESGEILREDTQVKWIIDPIDGTVNFAHNLPHFCVSIGVEFKGQIEHGVVYDPIQQELFIASRGQGAQLNGRRIRVSKVNILKQAFLATYVPINQPNALQSFLRTFGPLLENSAQFRQMGSAALMLAYVACGRYDAYFQKGIQPWDIAAGSLLVQEAGGFVGDYENKPDFLKRGEIVAGNRKVYTEIQKALEIAV